MSDLAHAIGPVEYRAEQKSVVSGSGLLSLYLVIPLLFLTILVDKTWLGNSLRDHVLPRHPADLIIWGVIFGFPHICSSMVTLIDKEYLQFYRKKLVVGLSIIAAFVIFANVVLPAVFPSEYSSAIFMLFVVFTAIYTMNHVLSQQFGIGMMMMRANRDRPYALWRWVSIIAASAMYIHVYGGRFVDTTTYFGYSGADILTTIAYVATAGVIALGFYQTRQSKTEMGSWYIYSNIIMIIAAALFLKLEYYAFVIVVPRVVHDITAFMIYSVHDNNRNRNIEKPPNLIYRALKFIPISPIFLCFPLAVVLASGVDCGFLLIDVNLGFSGTFQSACFFQDSYRPDWRNGLPSSMKLWIQAMFIITFFHYYIESFVWRRESIHRHSVKFNV